MAVHIPALPVRAADGAAPSLPLLFDSRERLAKPDLSALVRLRFLTTLDFPPFNFADKNGHLTGFQVDLVREICGELDIEAKCQIEAMPYPELPAALDKGEGDAVIAGVGVTSALRQNYLFSRPYMTLPARFVVNAGLGLQGHAVTALAGRAVGIVGGTTHEAMLKTWFPAIRPVAFPDRETMLAALKNGKIDGAFGDGVQLAFWAAGQSADHCCALFDGPYASEHFFGEGLSIMMRPDDDLVQQAIDHALLALSRKGRLKELYLRYFPYGLY
nr:transporter substrate-binding domain-containing protein [uncultured Gellertiella sp.]